MRSSLTRRFGLPGAVIAVTAFAASVRAADFTVTNTNSTGSGSLAQAITDANANPGADRIVFDIPGSGVHEIKVGQNPLPVITDAVVIDGYTQPGSNLNTAYPGSSNAFVSIQIDPSDNQAPFGNGVLGLNVQAAGCTIRGLIVTGFHSSDIGYGPEGGNGIVVNGDDCVIEGNVISGNEPNGLVVQSSRVTVGGSTPDAANVFIGNDVGIRVSSSAEHPVSDVRIARNQIGTNPGGPMPGTGNRVGVQLSSSDPQQVFNGVIVGGTSDEANYISGNDIGVQIGFTAETGYQLDQTGNGVVIKGNSIGLQPDVVGTPTVNQRVGIMITGSKNVVGGDASYPNFIAYNHTGVLVTATYLKASYSGNSIRSNRIYANSDIGIDLAPIAAQSSQRITGPTSNDFEDPDSGPNDLQNFPVITSVGGVRIGRDPDAVATVVNGVLNSTPNRMFTIDLYYSLGGTTQQFMGGSTVVTTNAVGDASFSISFQDFPQQTGRVYTVTATDENGSTSEFSPQTGPVQFANISTRAFVGTGENILIGGFIVAGQQSKRICVRGLGPSLNAPNKLADPYIELYDHNGTLLAKNDDWRSGQQQEISDARLAPSSDLESALIATLAPGNYTVHLFQTNGGSGNGIVEIYDLDPFPAATTRLANISTRGFVGADDNVLIGGTIVRGDQPEKICARALGPDLAAQGMTAPLQDPTIELRDSSGNLIASNDNWRQSSGEAPPSVLQPGDDRDAVITTEVAPGSYTAVVRGKNSGTGTAIVELYDLTNTQ